jgi:hypothetical protein
MNGFGQCGFYLKADGGTGASKSFFAERPFGGSGRSVLSFSGNIKVGYTLGKLQIETGLGYLRTGVAFTSQYAVPGCGMPTILPVKPAVTDPTNFTRTNDNIVLPLSVSRVIGTKSVSVIPGIGMAMYYNAHSNLKTDNPRFYEAGYVEPYTDNKLAGAVFVKADIAYRLNKHISLLFGPEASTMFTSGTKKVAGDNMSQVYYDAFLFNFGCRYQL